MKTICTFLFLCITMHIQSQSVDTNVISNSGGIDSNASHILNFTFGETFVGTISNSQSIDQGFWSGVTAQSSLSTEAFELDEDSIAVYPNPVSDFLTIKVPNVEFYNLTLFNINGMKILTQKVDVSNQGNRIDISSLAKGVYMLSLFIPEKFEHKTFKIIKK